MKGIRLWTAFNVFNENPCRNESKNYWIFCVGIFNIFLYALSKILKYQDGSFKLSGGQNLFFNKDIHDAYASKKSKFSKFFGWFMSYKSLYSVILKFFHIWYKMLTINQGADFSNDALACILVFSVVESIFTLYVAVTRDSTTADLLSGLFFSPFSMFLEFIYFDRQIETSNLLFAYSLTSVDFFMTWADCKIQRSLVKLNPEKYGYLKPNNLFNYQLGHLTDSILNKTKPNNTTNCQSGNLTDRILNNTKINNSINYQSGNLTDQILNSTLSSSQSDELITRTLENPSDDDDPLQDEPKLRINVLLYTKNIPLLIEFLKLFFFVKSIYIYIRNHGACFMSQSVVKSYHEFIGYTLKTAGINTIQTDNIQSNITSDCIRRSYFETFENRHKNSIEWDWERTFLITLMICYHYFVLIIALFKTWQYHRRDQSSFNISSIFKSISRFYSVFDIIYHLVCVIFASLLINLIVYDINSTAEYNKSITSTGENFSDVISFKVSDQLYYKDRTNFIPFKFFVVNFLIAKVILLEIVFPKKYLSDNRRIGGLYCHGLIKFMAFIIMISTSLLYNLQKAIDENIKLEAAKNRANEVIASNENCMHKSSLEEIRSCLIIFNVIDIGTSYRTDYMIVGYAMLVGFALDYIKFEKHCNCFMNIMFIITKIVTALSYLIVVLSLYIAFISVDYKNPDCDFDNLQPYLITDTSIGILAIVSFIVISILEYCISKNK